MELTRSIPQGDQGPGYGSWQVDGARQGEIQANFAVGDGSPANNPTNLQSFISRPSEWMYGPDFDISHAKVGSLSLYGDGQYVRGEDQPITALPLPAIARAEGQPVRPGAELQPNTPGYGDNNLAAIDAAMPAFEKPRTLSAKNPRGTNLGMTLMGNGPQRNVPRRPVA